jgi:hypothetical protein
MVCSWLELARRFVEASRREESLEALSLVELQKFQIP